MNLHEYQARQLLARFDVAVPQADVATSVEEATAIAEKLGGNFWVVKAQAHTGGRGKAGGVKVARSIDDVKTHAESLLNMRLVTHQTGPQGLPVNHVLIASGVDIERELYLSALIDRSSECLVMMASAAGGVDIEEVAAKTPEQIFSVAIHPATGLQSHHIRTMGFGLGFNKAQLKQFDVIIRGIYQMFHECDASMVEINPLVVLESGDLLALDAKVNLDGSALYRQKELAKWRDLEQEDPIERQASEHNLNYVSLDGSIACMVNGAGLAMATMDLIKLHGGEPANFLDVGGSADAERVCEAFKLIVKNDQVKAILVNIFGGIVRCERIADGIISAVQDVGVDVPVIARLEGNGAKEAKQKLADSGLEITGADDLTDAAEKAVVAAGGGKFSTDISKDNLKRSA
ncbi:MAG: ADP-forming succinate--CoA ligase subunit beta [Gammaproteobacteria bacterium]|nr:ADP-forming succinate--CoA ligase subunit beta [Gammaproteobacteria bacterium]